MTCAVLSACLAISILCEGAEATFKCGQKSQIMRCRTCSKRRIVRQSAAKIVKLCGEIAAKFP